MAKTPLKLYVETRTGDPRPKCKTKSLSSKRQRWIRGEGAHRVKSSSSMSGRIAGDADVEEVPDHPILDLFSKPNPYHSCPDVMKLLVNYLDVVGTAYWWIGDKTRLGTPKGIWPLPSHLLYPWREFPESKELISYWLFVAGRFQVKIDKDDVIDFKVADLWEPYSRGLSPTVGVWEHIGVNERMLGHTQNMLDNQARPDAVLTPDVMIGEYERQRLEQRINSKFRGGGFGAVLVTEESMKLQPISWSPTDVASLEVHEKTMEMVCHAYGVPLALVTKETNLANLEAARSQHAELGIWPRLITRDETLNRLLIPLYDDSGRLFLCSENPVPDDEEQALKKKQAAVQGGWMTRHEARTEDGLEEVEWAKKPTLPTAQQVLGEDGKPIPPPERPGMGGMNGNGRGSTGAGRNGSSNGNGKKKKKKTKATDIDELIKVTEAVDAGQMPLSLARDIVAKAHGESAAILFEEGCKDCKAGSLSKCVARKIRILASEHPDWKHDQVIAVAYSYCRKRKKDIDVTDPLAQRALERLDQLPQLDPGDLNDRVPVPFPVDDDPGYGVGVILTDEEWLAQPVATFNLRELCATQPSVKRSEVREFILDPQVTPAGDRGEYAAPGKSVPRIVRYAEDPETKKSELYIDNGHHHLTALWLLGRTEVSGRYLDLTKGREVVITVAPDPQQAPASTQPEPKSLVGLVQDIAGKVDSLLSPREAKVERDENGLVTKIIDENGREYAIERDERGLITGKRLIERTGG